MTKSANRRHDKAQAQGARLVTTVKTLLQAGRYADAIEPLQKLARLLPDEHTVFNNLGVAYTHVRRFPEAVASLRRAIRLRPGWGASHHNLGLALYGAGQEEAAIAAHRDAVRFAPELSESHARLADLLWERGSRVDAAAAYARAAEATRAPFARMWCRAMSAYAVGRDAEAEGHLRELVVAEPSNLAAHLRLGKMLQETGRYDEATEIFERAIVIEPYESRAYHGIVSSKRMAESDRPLLARLLSRLDTRELGLRFSPAAAENHEMWFHFAAGKTLNDLGEYAAAMDHFRAANRIRRQRRSERDFLNVVSETRRIVARYDADFFREHARMGDRDETPVFIIGMPRSGSTLLERIVSSHPKVIGCGEVAYWSEQGPKWAFADPALLQENADKLRNDYLLLLRRGESGAVRSIDKMSGNFPWVGLVHVLFPNARFIHCRRSPLDTCLSIYATPMGKSWEFAGDLNDLATCYELYRRLMDHWRSVIPPDRLLDVDYEDVVREPEPWARRLIDFCGLPWDAACLRPEENPAAVKTASHWQVRQRIHGGAVERWRRYEPWLDELKRLH